MKIIKNILLSTILFLFFNYSYCQQKTVYEKKVEELSFRLFKELGVSQTQISRVKEMGNIESMFMAGEIMKKISTIEGLVLMERYSNELKKAEYLKTEVDYRKDKIKKNKEITLKKSIEQKKTLEEFNNSDYSKISKSIKSEFEKWNQKGEFEKEADYIIRLQVQSQNVFEEICIKQIKDKINNYSVDYNLRKELSAYNSEKEYFTAIFKINGVEWQNRINIPISKAENFKNNWSDLTFKINDFDWCFVENSLCPTLVTIEENEKKSKYEFPLSIKNQSEIFYSSDNIEVSNSNLKGYVFKYSNAKAITGQLEKEKQRLDSLELTQYNQKLDSILKDYNYQLLKNPHNIKQRIMSDYEKVISKDDSKYDFSRSISSMKYNFEQQNMNFEYEFENEYNENGKLFANKEEFDNIYNQGNTIYTVEATKRKALNILEVNAIFIESMDFKKDKRESVGSALARGLLANANNGSNIYVIDYTNENKTRHTILSLIKNNEGKPYYPQIMDFVIETNKSLNKEWAKNGQFFENKQVFYKAYLLEEYKAILKDSKEK